MFGRRYPWTNVINRLHKKAVEDITGQPYNVAHSIIKGLEDDKLLKEKYPWLCRLEDLQNTVEVRLEKLWDFLNFPRTFYLNYFVSGTHVIRTGLQKGKWHDRPEKIFYGLMNEIVEFVEKEATVDYYKNKKYISEDGPDGHTQIHEKTYSIYIWYKEVLPRKEKELDELSELYTSKKKEEAEKRGYDTNDHMHIFTKDSTEVNQLMLNYRSLSDEIEREKIEMMHNIIEVNDSLWT